MKPINVEILMDHTIGVSDSYYKPIEKDFGRFLKAANKLTITKNNNALVEQGLKFLREENENNEISINAKLRTRWCIKVLSDKMMNLMDEIQKLKK